MGMTPSGKVDTSHSDANQGGRLNGVGVPAHLDTGASEEATVQPPITRVLNDAHKKTAIKRPVRPEECRDANPGHGFCRDGRSIVPRINVRNGFTVCSLLATLGRMYSIIETEAFSDWLNGLKDTVTRMRLIKRLQRAGLGNLGDVKPVGEGVYEMREFFGPGWRMYYVQQGDVLLIMLGGGDKSSQQRDIERAIQLSKEL